MIDTQSDNWRTLPFWLRWWFYLNVLDLRPHRSVVKRIEIVSHIFGFVFCSAGFWNEASLVGGIIMLANAYWFCWLKWLGDKYGLWYDQAV